MGRNPYRQGAKSAEAIRCRHAAEGRLSRIAESKSPGEYMTSANKVNLVSHPLVQHKLTLMREHDRSTKGFRELLNEIGTLLCYEVTSDLPLEMVDIETPLTPMKAPMIAGKKLTFAPILRAGAAASPLSACPRPPKASRTSSVSIPTCRSGPPRSMSG